LQSEPVKIISVIFGWLILVVWASSNTGCATALQPALARYEFTRVEMALPFRITLFASNSLVASNAATRAFDRIHQLNEILSDYDSDSELSRLSQTSVQGLEVKVSDDLWNVLSASQEISRMSDGAFDISVGPLVNLWRKARRDKKFPRTDLLADARSRVGYTNIVLNERNHAVRLLHPNMRLDVGGIGKGYALDEAMKVLRAQGIHRALITGAGDMAVGDAPPDKNGWRVELPPLDAPDAPVTQFVLLKNCGFATSGDLFQRLEIDGKRYSHIVDPRTGIGLTDHSLVNIIASDATTADALSKVVSVLGSEKGFRIVRQKSAEARAVRKPDAQIELHETPGFKRFYESENKKSRSTS
jgi:thiamine biosynthesis lipoprotein